MDLCVVYLNHATFFFSEIYRIVSNKALETSNNAIKPTGGQTILVSQSPDDQKPAGGCC